MLGFTPYWDYKPTNAIRVDFPGAYTKDKILNLSIIDKILLKCNVVDGSIVNGKRESILFSFMLDKRAVYKIFCELETTQSYILGCKSLKSEISENIQLFFAL